MQSRRLTDTIVCILLAGTVSGCGGTVIRIGKPPALRSDRETQLIARQPVSTAPTPVDRAPGLAPSTTPLSSEPPVAVPPTATPLPLAASLGQGQGEGLPPEPKPAVGVAPLVPTVRTVPFSEALRILADHHGIRLAPVLSADPAVEIAATPGPDLGANLRSLLSAVTPTHYASVSLDRDGLPMALIVAPYPIVGGSSK